MSKQTEQTERIKENIKNAIVALSTKKEVQVGVVVGVASIILGAAQLPPYSGLFLDSQ